MNAGGDTEKMLEEYKKDMAEDEKADYDARTPEEKTAWLRFQRPPAASLVSLSSCGMRLTMFACLELVNAQEQLRRSICAT